MKLTGQCNAELAKTKNIVEMAFDFTAMVRVFAKDSKEKIKAKLEEHFLCLKTIRTQEDYEDFHRKFCKWFTGQIRTAGKKSEAASYGHAAKVLDIAIKGLACTPISRQS
jgi:hypothetical protein